MCRRTTGCLICLAALFVCCASSAPVESHAEPILGESRGAIETALIVFIGAVALGLFLAGRNLRFHQKRAARLAELRKAAQPPQGGTAQTRA